MLLGHHLWTRRWKEPRPIVIKTIIPIVQVAAQQREEVRPKAAATPPPKQIATAAPKQAAVVPKKAVANPKPQPKKASSTGTAAKKADTSLLKEIAESLDAISSVDKPSTWPSFALNVPSKIQAKAQLVSEDAAVDPSYGELLIAFLQNALDLPEYGEVRVKIEINRFGRVVDCQILEAKSAKNAAFLKNQLPELAFPCLNGCGISDEKQTFTITFRNVEMP